MERPDTEMEQRVWARVSGYCPSPRDDSLPGLMSAALQSAAVLQSLARSETGKRREKLARLAESEADTAAALGGILLMEGAEAPDYRPQPAREHPRRQLAGCLHRCRECRDAFLTRSTDRGYDAVYLTLAQRAAEQMTAILALMQGYSGRA